MSLLQFGDRPTDHMHCFVSGLLITCNLAVELAMASKASNVDLENSTIQTEMFIEIVRS